MCIDDYPRFSITSLESIKARHREDTMVVNNMEYVISDHEKNANDRYEKYRQKGNQIQIRILSFHVYHLFRM